MVIVERVFLVRLSRGKRYGTLGPLQTSHYVLAYKGCYSTLDYIFGGGLINRGTPLHFHWSRKDLSIFFARYLK